MKEHFLTSASVLNGKGGTLELDSSCCDLIVQLVFAIPVLLPNRGSLQVLVKSHMSTLNIHSQTNVCQALRRSPNCVLKSFPTPLKPSVSWFYLSTSRRDITSRGHMISYHTTFDIVSVDDFGDPK